MERFNFNKEQNKIKNFTENKSESVEDGGGIEKIKAIQNEEKEFLGGIKEYARNAFHFVHKNYKENFKKTLRAVALATILSIPIGEKAFAEREGFVRESTTVIAEIDKEIKRFEQLQQPQDAELFKTIIEQKQILKEKYNADIIEDNSEYTLEELQDFEKALEKVQNFAPKKFEKLKIILLKDHGSGFFEAGMKVFPNLTTQPNILEESKNKFRPNYKKDLFEFKQKILEIDETEKQKQNWGKWELLELKSLKSNRALNFLDKLMVLEDDCEYGTRAADQNNYDIILSCDKKNAEKFLEEKEGVAEIISWSQTKDFYKEMFIHEISHLITLNNHDEHKELADKFDKINKKIPKKQKNKIIVDLENNIERYSGFVSDYAATIPMNPDARRYKLHNTEDTAETLTYMINDYHYADDDPIVQEKIEAIKNFLNEKTND